MMLDPHTPKAADMQLYTDASSTHGFGAYYLGEWFRGDWRKQQNLEGKSIAWQELFAVVVACLAWGSQWSSKRVLVHCDNQTVADLWQHGSSRCPALMSLVRCMFFAAASNNYTVVIKHIPGSHNVIADALSRAQMAKFRAQAPGASLQPTPLPPGALTLGLPDQQRPIS